ncbi:hypothetical protein BASA81_003818 [Batrachochytrium salamandrivorans]|nr:hypothetical protein BASA81_003818 [Batrachochytrium salamandrivorans]
MAKAEIGQKKREENAARWRAWHKKNRDEYNLRRRIATKARGRKDTKTKPTVTSPIVYFTGAGLPLDARYRLSPPSPLLFSALRVIPPPLILTTTTTPPPMFWTSTYQPISPLGSNIGFAWKQEANRALSSALHQSS